MFFAEVVKIDGTNYEPQSLKVMIACHNRKLRLHDKPYSILIYTLSQRLEMMLSKRLEEMKHLGPLYLTPLKKPKPNLWYSRLPVVVHMVNNFMKSIADDGELTENGKCYSNKGVDTGGGGGGGGGLWGLKPPQILGLAL